MNENKLWYVKGNCELEKGIVKFAGTVKGVSIDQAWYYVINAIKYKFPKIDFWITPQIDDYKMINYKDKNDLLLMYNSSELKLKGCYRSNMLEKLYVDYMSGRIIAYGGLSCTFEPFPNGEIRRKPKLTEPYNAFTQNLSYIIKDENIKDEKEIIKENKEFNSKLILTDQDLILRCLDTEDIYDSKILKDLIERLNNHKELLNDYSFSYIAEMTSRYKKIHEKCLSITKKLQSLEHSNTLILITDMYIKSRDYMEKITETVSMLFNN